MVLSGGLQPTWGGRSSSHSPGRPSAAIGDQSAGRHPAPLAGASGVGGLAATVLFLVAAATDLPFRGRLWLSESALRQYIAGPPGDNVGGGAAGLFEFKRVIRTENGAVYFITGYNFKDSYGFVYLPPGVNSHLPVEHVFGLWYWFDSW